MYAQETFVFQVTCNSPKVCHIYIETQRETLNHFTL